jgi:ApbE superfamily uncharacterized protein (UPF0280 family)
MGNNLKEADVRLALLQTEGNLTSAAGRLKVSRTELSEYIDANPKFKTVISCLKLRRHVD